MASTPKEVKCPSGAILKIYTVPFGDAKNLYQCLLRQLQTVPIDLKMHVAAVLKDLFCLSFSSPEIEEAIMRCMTKCTYNTGRVELKIDKDTFESIEARSDYMTICVEVAEEVLAPFLKNLSAEFVRFSQKIEKFRI